MAFSDRSRLVVESFLMNMGLPKALSEDGSCNVAFDKSGTFSLVQENGKDQIWMSLSWTVPQSGPTPVIDRKLLDFAGSDSELFPVLLHAGKAEDGSLVLSANVEENDFSASTINAVLQRMLEIREAI